MNFNNYFDIEVRKEIAKETLAVKKVLKIIFLIWLGIVIILAFN